MRSFFFFFSALALAASVLAQDIDSNDVPSQCTDACASVVSLTARCDKSTNDDDSAERKCVCDDPDASKSVPNCAACLDEYSKDGKDNDANDIVRKCSFASTTYDPTMTSSSTSTSSPSSTTGATAESSTPPSAGHSTGLTPGLFGMGIGISLLASVGL